MRFELTKVVAALACVLSLAACETTGVKMPWSSQSAEGPKEETTGSVGETASALPPDQTPASTGVAGENPKDDLNLGKRYYRENQFGLAEQHFRKAAEQSPRSVEAWIGLAASYDKLKRYDLADRAYAQATRLAGPTAEILNNQGYSYMLRGDRNRARKTLLLARSKDPNNPYIQNNLDLLDESFAQRKDAR